MKLKDLQFSLNQSFKNFYNVVKHPHPSGWTAAMSWGLGVLPIILVLIHPFDAEVSASWSLHTTKFQQILASSTNVIKSGYWMALGLSVWWGMAYYIRLRAPREAPAYAVRAKQAGLYLFFSLICASIPVTIIKYAVGRARPHLLEQFGADYFSPLTGGYLYVSFPSGHAMVAGVLAVFSWKFLPLLKWVAIPLILLLAFSRVVVAAHYPTDVTAGFMMGAIVSLWLYNFLSLRNIISPVAIMKKI